MIYKFTVHGNPTNPDGNPVPYKRTLNWAMRKEDRKYFAWHEHVRRTAMEDCRPIPDEPEVVKVSRNTFIYYPFNLSMSRARVDMKIYWMNDQHGDADNVFKGILDAIFRNDKNVVAGSYESSKCPEKKGRVEVTVTIL